MELLTLAAAKASRIKEVTQSCSSSDEFLSLLNEATKRLMQRGDWAGLMVPIYICVRQGCVTWPKYISKVRRINRCNNEVKVGNLWYDFINKNSPDANYYASGIGGNPAPDLYRLVNKGNAPTYSDIAGDARTVRVYPSVPQDVGKTVKIFGVDNNGQPLRENVNDIWVDGQTLTIALPYAESTGFVRRIDRVIKDATQGNVRLYAYDTVNLVLEDLANYDPSETLPNYERDQVILGNTCCSSSKSVTALVKLRYVPAVSDTDLVLISNTTALKFMIQAIKLEEGGDRNGARECVLGAVAELNLELDDESPRDQTPVDSGFMGGSYIASQRMI